MSGFSKITTNLIQSPILYILYIHAKISLPRQSHHV